MVGVLPVRGPPLRHDEPRAPAPALEGTIADAAELKPGDRVVYPNQGVCKIEGTEKKEIAGQLLDLVRMTREEDGAAVMVPTGKVPAIGLRRVASAEQIDGVFHYLGASYEDPELDWKVRHRDNADRLIAGGVLGVVEVVKGLHSLSRLRPLPTKEREQYDGARHLLVNEVSVSLGVPPGLAEDFIDYALMPPAGVKFQLKPPPKPVVLPPHPFRRKRLAEAEEEDLGLADLGLDLGALEPEAAPGEAAPAQGAEGEGGAEQAAPAEEAVTAAPAPEKPARKAATRKAAPKKKARPAAKKAPRKAPRPPAKKPARGKGKKK